MKASRLFWRSVLEGMASPVSLYCVPRSYEVDAKKILEFPSFYQPKRSDSEALRADWERVGHDIQSAINQYAAEVK